jgi:hypothetical protein
VEGFLGAVVVDEVLQNLARDLVHAGVDGVGLIHDLSLENLPQLLVRETPNARSSACTRS